MATITITRHTTLPDSSAKSDFHNLVDTATAAISNIAASDFASGVGIVTTAATAPADTTSIWVDSSCTPYVVRIYDGSEWIATGGYAVLTNKSGSQVTRGAVCVIDTANAGAFTTTTTASDPRQAVIAMETIDNAGDGVVAMPGARVTAVAMEGAINPGEWFATASTAGKGVKAGTNVYGCALATLTGAGTLAEAILASKGVSTANAGTSGQFLKSAGVGVVPAWAFAFAKCKLIATTRDISLTTDWDATTYGTVGFTPVAVDCIWTMLSTSGTGFSGSDKSAGAIVQSATVEKNTSGAALAVFYTDTDVYNTMSVKSYDADGATFSFVKTGVATGTATVYLRFWG